MLLPHGYEGQGPEHSSARSRKIFTGMCSRKYSSIKLHNTSKLFSCTKKAASSSFQKTISSIHTKIIIETQRCISEIEDFTKENSFHRVLSDKAEYSQYNMIPLSKDEEIEKVILCTGKIYYDLVDERENKKQTKFN